VSPAIAILDESIAMLPPTIPILPCRAHILPDQEPHFPDSEPVEVKKAGMQDYAFQNSFVLDYDQSNIDRKHVLIPFEDQIHFIDANFVCKFCGNS
jgi:hypothetical protein